MFKRSIPIALAAALFTLVSVSAAAPDAYAAPLAAITGYTSN